MTASVAAIRLGEATRIQAVFLRRMGRVMAILAGCVGVVIGLEILQAKLIALDSPLNPLSSVRLTMFALLAFAWGASMWRGEAPKNRQYFLAHPVDASAHELSRVAAGGMWLMAAVGVATVLAIAGALIRHDTAALAEGVQSWVGLFTATLLIYFITAAVATLTGRVVEVFVFGYLGLVLIIPLIAMTRIGERLAHVFKVVITGQYGLRAALVAPIATGGSALAEWLVALVIWYAVAAVIMAAVLRWRRGRLADR
jgi:hypothetical protein